MRRLREGGAAALLLVVGLLAVGCGSSAHKTAAAEPAATATSKTPATRHAATAARHQTPVGAHPIHGASPNTTALTSAPAALALANQLSRQAQAARSAAAAARRAAAHNPANATCTVTFKGRRIPVACAIQRQLQQAALHNHALAALFAATAAGSH